MVFHHQQCGPQGDDPFRHVLWGTGLDLDLDHLRTSTVAFSRRRISTASPAERVSTTISAASGRNLYDLTVHFEPQSFPRPSGWQPGPGPCALRAFMILPLLSLNLGPIIFICGLTATGFISIMGLPVRLSTVRVGHAHKIKGLQGQIGIYYYPRQRRIEGHPFLGLVAAKRCSNLFYGQSCRIDLLCRKALASSAHARSLP